MALDGDSSSELSSDEEVNWSQCLTATYFPDRLLQLQRGLAEGTLKPGLVGEVVPPKTFTNNVVRILNIAPYPVCFCVVCL